MANYTRPGQTMDIYELDPDVDKIARGYFTYLEHAQGKIDVIYGDARRSLVRRPGKKYDLFIVDAFGGDSIPFHLLTKEAIAEYRDHLNPGGILLCHISNRFVRLEPVLVGVAEVSGAQIGYRMTSGRPYGIPSAWAIFTWDEAQFRDLVTNQHWVPIAYQIKERHRVWTDGYSNILPVLDLAKIKRSILNFKLSSDL
jgi:SAM-dependent methyltransferase